MRISVHSSLISDIVVSKGERHREQQAAAQGSCCQQCRLANLFLGSGGAPSDLDPALFTFQLSINKYNDEPDKCQMSHCAHGFIVSQKQIFALTLEPGSVECVLYITGCAGTVCPAL